MAKKNNQASKKSASAKKTTAAKKTAAKKSPAKKAAAKKVAPEQRPAANRSTNSPAAAREQGKSDSAANRPAARSERETRSVPARARDGEPAPATTISAKVDIGFGNILYIRGEGPGLSWNKGVPMDCVAADEWIWRTRSASGAFACKVLINDEIWSMGDDFRVPPGERLVCYPSF